MGQDRVPCAGTASLAARAGNDLWFVDFGQFQCLAKGLEGCGGIGLTGKSLALQPPFRIPHPELAYKAT